MDKIDVVFYINLEHRTDRKEHFLKEISKLCPDDLIHKIVRIDAIKNENGILGCTLSHIKTMELFLKNEDWKTCIIFEDDFTFYESNIDLNNELLNEFLNNFKEWDVCNLSINPRCAIYSETKHPNVKKAIEIQAACGYCLNKSFAPTLLNLFKICRDKISIDPNNKIYSPDIAWKSLQEKNNWYVLNPDLGYQMNNFSDIDKKFVEHNHNREYLHYFILNNNDLKNLKLQLDSLKFHKSFILKIIIVDYNSDLDTLLDFYNDLKDNEWIEVHRIKNRTKNMITAFIDVIKEYHQIYNFKYFAKSNVYSLIPPVKDYFRQLLNINQFFNNEYQIGGALDYVDIPEYNPQKNHISDVYKNQFYVPSKEWIVWVNKIRYIAYKPLPINLSMSIIPSTWLINLKNTFVDINFFPGIHVLRTLPDENTTSFNIKYLEWY